MDRLKINYGDIENLVMDMIGPASDLTIGAEFIVESFHQTFQLDYQIDLVRGGDEPLYLPRSADYARDRIFYAKGFWSSALHEIAHWCVAGPARRRQMDYGYWYAPDGRDLQQQLLFEQVEIKPQAIEWLFTSALTRKFFISFDNLDAGGHDPQGFRQAVRRQALDYLAAGLPKRADRFLNALLVKQRSNDAFVRYWQRVRRESILPD